MGDYKTCEVMSSYKSSLGVGKVMSWSQKGLGAIEQEPGHRCREEGGLRARWDKTKLSILKKN